MSIVTFLEVAALIAWTGIVLNYAGECVARFAIRLAVQRLVESLENHKLRLVIEIDEREDFADEPESTAIGDG